MASKFGVLGFSVSTLRLWTTRLRGSCHAPFRVMRTKQRNLKSHDEVIMRAPPPKLSSSFLLCEIKALLYQPCAADNDDVVIHSFTQLGDDLVTSLDIGEPS